MKFQSQDEKDVLARLMLSSDFRYYVKMLGTDYEKAIADLLYGPPDQAESRRGHARALHDQLKSLGVIEK
jgi:hypothetical protein